MPRKQNYYTIGEISTICNVNQKTLRYYDSIGLVRPEHKNPETGYRYYSREQAFTIYIVRKLQKLNFCLKEIKEMISADQISVYKEYIEKKIEDLDEEIKAIEQAKEDSNTLLNKMLQHDAFYSNDFSLAAEQTNTILPRLPSIEDIQNDVIKVETFLPQTVLSTTRPMKLYNNFEISIDRWFEIFRLVEENHFTPIGNITLVYHTESPMDQFYKPQCTLEVALPIKAGEALKSENNGYQLKQSRKICGAVIYHIGDYNTIIQSHLKMLRWLELNKYTISGPTQEEYLISPFDLNTDERYLTKIIYPIS